MLNLSLLKDISDDIDFCFKLAKEDTVIILPGNRKLKLDIFTNEIFLDMFGAQYSTQLDRKIYKILAYFLHTVQYC